MEETVRLLDRPLRVIRTARAERALGRREQALPVELELFFSCLLRQRVRFPERLDPESGADTARTSDGQVVLRFRPVMSRYCTLAEGHHLEAFPIERPGPFVPRWVRIDHHPRHGWSGELGFAAAEPVA